MITKVLFGSVITRSYRPHSMRFCDITEGMGNYSILVIIKGPVIHF